jgi:hypothetical protein
MPFSWCLDRPGPESPGPPFTAKIRGAALRPPFIAFVMAALKEQDVKAAKCPGADSRANAILCKLQTTHCFRG